MLTPVLSQVMLAIEELVRNGMKPSLRTLTEMTGRKAHSNVSRNVDMLVERGFVSRNASDSAITPIRTIAEEIAGVPVSEDPLVLFVDRHQKMNDATTPSYRQICHELGIASKSEINRRITELILKGHIRIPPIGDKIKINRCLHVVKEHEFATPGSARDDEGKTNNADL